MPIARMHYIHVAYLLVLNEYARNIDTVLSINSKYNVYNIHNTYEIHGFGSVIFITKLFFCFLLF